AAMKDMQAKYHVISQGDVFATNMPKDMEKVYINLSNKSNWGTGLTAGFMGALGVDWLIDKAAGLAEDITGLDLTSGESVQDQFAGIQTAHKGAYTAGNIAGSLAALLGGSAAVKAGAAAVPAFSKLAPAMQGVVKSGATFGLTGGYQALTNTVSQKEWDAQEQEIQKYYAQQGIRYDPVDYNAWEQVGNVAAQTGISALGGAAGSFAGQIVGNLGKSILVKQGLQTPFAEALRQTLSGTAFAAGNTAATYWLYPEESRPSKEKIAQDLAVAFLFSAVTSTVSTMQTTKANKAFIDNAVTQMKKDYQSTLNGGMSAEEQLSALDDILAYNKTIRGAISQNYYAGQQKYIDEILQAMDALDEQINIIKNGMASASPNVPAPVTPYTPPVAQQPAAPAPAVVPPAGNPPVKSAPPIPAPVNEPQTDVATALKSIREAGAKNVPYETVVASVADIVSAGAITDTQVSDAYAEGLAEYNKQHAEPPKKAPARTTKKDWPSTDVQWTVPGKKLPIAYSTVGTSNSIGVMADDHPDDTVSELQKRFIYDADAKKVLQAYIDAGHGDTVASTMFSYDRRGVRGSGSVQKAEPPTNAPLPEPAVSDNIEVGSEAPHDRLAAVLADKLISKGTTFNSSLLFEQADKAYGGTMAAGAYTVKDAYDALELAVNKTLLSSAKPYNGDTLTAIGAEKALQQLLDTLPTQTKRTEEQQSFQQFSTPPNIAYLAAWAANITGKDTVLEPSAGIGGLAVFPKAWGATVVVNELSERRLGFLKSMGFDRVFNENAEQLNNVLPDDVMPSVVLMNPPFSSTAGRTATNKTENATRHIEQALLRLQDGGRLVAILGRGMADDSHTFSKWWDSLREKYDIRANISIDGSNYKKYGTTFDVQLVVIDKTGAQTGKTITGTYKNLTEIPSALEGVRNDRQKVEISNAASGERSVDKPVSKGTAGGGGTRDISRGGTGSPARASTGSERAGAIQRGDGAGSGALEQGGSDGAAQQDKAGADGIRVGGSDSGVPGDVHSEPEQHVATRPEPQPALRELKPQRKKAAKSDNGIFAEYIPAELPIKGAKKHPAPLVESAAMAAVSAPQATYKPNLPKALIEGGGLSSAQLENIVYAGQAHQQTLPDGTRKGYFIGDGTGVGKGRQISGIILDNMRQGRKKAVWVSKNFPLVTDAVRDWVDIGGKKEDIFSQDKVKVSQNIDRSEGILFTGYGTLPNKGRLDQIVNWLGKDFDGVIAFDEAHNMGNLLGKKGARGATKGSAKAQAGVELQKLLPNARVVYVSATGATDVNELAYAQRLGLWGRGTAFHDVNDFISKIGSSGIAAMELVARDMKAMGSYLARSISYDGVTYDTLQHTLTPMQTEIYNTMSSAWQITMQNITEALKITNANLNAQAKSAAKSAYYGAMQRFYNQVLTSMSMPSVIEDIKKELAAGHSCVLQIVNTNAAEQERQLAKIKDTGGDLEDMDLTPRGTLIGYLENSFPVYAYEEYTDENGKTRSRIVEDKNGKPVVDREAVAMRDKLIAQINEMSIPDGPLEMLFDTFGTEAVAEVTGRGRRIVPKTDEKGHTVRVEERRTKNHTEADIQAFQDGKKHILVFSDAGGTGKSYHADVRAKNQQKRTHYLVQPGWSASTATQGFGRSHRSNQATTPQFKLVTTNIMGQKRFVSTIARRLDQLGALTKGQRETGSGMFTEKDNLESTLAKDSLRLFYENLGKNRIEGIDGLTILGKLGLSEKFTDEYGNFKIVDENVARDMNTFLNRILALEVDEQNTVFNEFYRIFETQYDKALESGNLDRGMESVKADKIVIVDDKIIRTDETTGATTNYVQAKTYQRPALLTSIRQLEDYRSDFQGLYKTDSGEVRAVYRVADKPAPGMSGKINKVFRLQSPVVTKYGTWIEDTLNERAQKLDKKEWADAWKSELAKAPEYNEQTIHMLTGTLLPIWDRLPQDGNTRAMRITADDGTQYLGRVIPADRIDAVLRQLGAGGRTKETFTAKDVMKRVMAGETARLTKDHQALVRKRVSGEYRMEVTGKNLWYLTRNYPGIISEYINYESRYFIPIGENGEAILAALIKDNPVAEVYSGGDVDLLISTDTGKQAIKSSDTSINSAKLPAVFSKVKFEPGTVNLDIGGGRFDNATNYLAEQGVKSYIYDPYNRTPEHNAAAAKATQEGQSDTVTISNVLNVIQEPDARAEVLLNAVDAVKDGGTVYITIYEGNRSGKGAATTKGWQENRLTSSYIPEVRKYFADVPPPKNGVIVAKSPRKKRLSEPAGSDKDFLKSSSVAASQWGAYRGGVDNKWSAERVGGTDKKPMPISDIISKIRHDFGIPVTKGRMPRRTIAGQYDRHSHSIQTRITNDLP
ncbi:MAG: strawberry notch family protein, partial [Eubacteriales bacterium]|nr:strawberry notch family protein [Eubacteriales bacterium]